MRKIMSKIMVVVLALVTLFVAIPSVYAADVYFDGLTDLDSMNRPSVSCNLNSKSDTRYNVQLDSETIQKIVSGADKKLHVGICISGKSSDSRADYWGSKINVKVASLKSKKTLKVYKYDGDKFLITNNICKFDKNGNLNINLPIHKGTYYLADSNNQKEIDEEIFKYSELTPLYLKNGESKNFLNKAFPKKYVKSITVKASNKNVTVNGLKVKMNGGKSTLTLKIVLKDGYKKTIKIPVYQIKG